VHQTAKSSKEAAAPLVALVLTAPDVVDVVFCERVVLLLAVEPGGAEMMGDEPLLDALLLLMREVLFETLFATCPIAC